MNNSGTISFKIIVMKKMRYNALDDLQVALCNRNAKAYYNKQLNPKAVETRQIHLIIMVGPGDFAMYRSVILLCLVP